MAAKTTAVAEKRSSARQKEGATETKSVTPAAKPKSRNFKAEREARAKEQAERRKQQDNRPKRDRKDNQRYGDNRNQRPQERNEQRNQGSERRNLADQIKDVVHNPVAPKVDFKARAAALKAEQNAEYARGSEDRYKTTSCKSRTRTSTAPETGRSTRSESTCTGASC